LEQQMILKEQILGVHKKTTKINKIDLKLISMS